MDIEILRPEVVWTLWLGLVPLLACAWVLPRRFAALRAVADPRHLGRLFPALRRRARNDDVLGWIRRRAWTRALLGSLALLLIVASLVGPVRGFALVPVQERRIDVVVALDTSRSMLVEDVEPNRLERAKAEVGALLDVMRGERVALVAFAGQARDVAPLTPDLDTIRYFLQRLSPDDNRQGGTDLGAALRLSLDRFENASGANEAVVLVTDGEDLTGEGLAAAEAARDRGIRVQVLGMGTEGGGKVPDGSGGFVIDPEATGGPADVVSQLKSESLRAIADTTGGIYLEARGRVLPLEQLYSRAIAPMEGRDIVDGKERVPRDRYQWPLVLALVLLLLEGGLREVAGRDERPAGTAGESNEGAGSGGEGPNDGEGVAA
ncbi:MAG: VWA domain-containing protein [Planctomycetota bacterium]